jgi:putative transposase
MRAAFSEAVSARDPGGLLAELTKRLVERAMEVELTEHLGYEPHQEPPGGPWIARWPAPRRQTR